jgi:predicted unusual protein kinase regulating ubiquinone biosynthesis (AarF/ABC1/UbiB family)
MLGKTLLNLDRVGTTLDPTLDPQAVIRRHASEIMRQRVQRSLSFGSFFTTLLDLKEFVRAVPQRVNRILDLAANNELGFKVDAIDERQLMEGLQKIANRITMGLVLAALIVGAAMLTNVATILFLAAATGGVILVLNIVINDVKAKKRR